MIDDPEQTQKLIDEMTALLPFEVRLPAMLATHLRADGLLVEARRAYMVRKIQYAGDEGGIVCHVDTEIEDRVLVASLSQLEVPRSVPVAQRAAAYQKHRVKKLKKLNGRGNAGA